MKHSPQDNHSHEEHSRGLKRREFVGLAAAAAGALTFGVKNRMGAQQAEAATGTRFVADLDAPIEKGKKPTDLVALGKSGIKVSMVGIGTGTMGSDHASNQTRLGQPEFTRIVRHGLDSGISFYDLSDSYGSHEYFTRAMQGVPRGKYVIQTKTDSRDAAQAKADIDRYLRELKTDHIESMLIHCVTEGDWTTRFRGVMDVFEEAKKAGKIGAHGVTCHSFEALQAAYASDWVQIHQVRWNTRGKRMDADVKTAGALFQKMRAKGQGMIGMKVVGQGDIVNGRNALSPEACCRFQVESGVVDAFVVGVENTKQLDQILHGTQLALHEVGYRGALV
ncbi:MAG TPA: aldo/keto reductase [Abditibacteriaceae bacterium]|jgi:predicted aldo/keto reductase-like oxidoreductase